MARQRLRGEIALAEELAKLIRYRNYAVELRVIAEERTRIEDLEALLRIAADYERIAKSLEAVVESRAHLNRLKLITKD